MPKADAMHRLFLFVVMSSNGHDTVILLKQSLGTLAPSS